MGNAGDDQARSHRPAPAALPCRHTFCLPLGNITAAHALHAAAKLLQYDVVLDLDDAGKARDRLLRLGMGWQATLSDMHARPKLGDPLGRLMLLQKDVVPRLRELHQHDTFVYAEAQLMSQVDGAWLAEVEQLITQHQRQQHPQGAQPGSVPSEADLVRLVAANMADATQCGYFGGWVQRAAAAAAS
jgi:hypothetical protein